MKKIFPIFLCLLSVFLSSCGSLSPAKKSTQKIEIIALEKDVFIEAGNLFPLPFEGVYLQHLTSTFKNKKHEFSVHLTLSPNAFKAVAFNDIAGQLYELNWQEDSLTWTSSSFIPKHFNPQYILADFLITHLPLETLQKHLKGATAFDTKNKRILQKNDTIVREVIYENSPQNSLQNARLRNARRHYELHIKTVVLP